MENATKALLIAAAVLIAILIISFALIIYNMAAETVGNVNLSEAEMNEFNSRFTTFEGPSVSGAQVNALINTVLRHNNSCEKGKGVRVDVYDNINNPDEVRKLSALTAGENGGSPYFTKVPVNNNYSVTCNYSNGLVSSITVRIKR